MTAMPTQRKGFTLVEILIVVAIIGILSSVALVGLGPIQKRGRDARRISDVRSVQGAVELYFSANGFYPKTPADWTAFKTALETTQGVKNVPDDPLGGTRHYHYSSDTDGTSYIIGAELEDDSNPVLTNDIDAATPAGWSPSFNCDDNKGTSGTHMYCIGL